MNNIKELASKFMDSISYNDYPHANQAYKVGKLTKAATVLIAGTILAGCANPNYSNTDIASDLEYQREQAVQIMSSMTSIKELNMDSVKEMASGESGFYRDDSGTVIIVSNFNGKESLNQEEKYAYSKIINPNFDYKDSSLSNASKYQPYAFIKVNKNDFDDLVEKTNSPYLKAFVESGDVPAFITLHELSHRLNNTILDDHWESGLKHDLTANSKQMPIAKLWENGADVGGSLLLAKAKNYSYNQAMHTFKAVRDIREQTALNGKDTSHDTVAVMNSMIKTLEDNPKVYTKLMESSIVGLQKGAVDIVVSSSLTQDKVDQLRVQVQHDIRERLEQVALGKSINEDSVISKLMQRSSMVFDYFDYAQSEIIQNNNGNPYSTIDENAQYDIDSMFTYIHRALGENLVSSYFAEEMKTMSTNGIAEKVNGTIENVKFAEHNLQSDTENKYSKLKLRTPDGFSL